VRKRKPGDLRVALFPDSYAEIDGVATVSRNLEAFAKKRDLQFLTIHAGPCEQIMNSGSVTKVQPTPRPIHFPPGPGAPIRLGFLAALSSSTTYGAGFCARCNSNYWTKRRWNAWCPNCAQSERALGSILGNESPSIWPVPFICSAFKISQLFNDEVSKQDGSMDSESRHALLPDTAASICA
jgi:hypothetical protein